MVEANVSLTSHMHLLLFYTHPRHTYFSHPQIPNMKKHHFLDFPQIFFGIKALKAALPDTAFILKVSR